jgi:phospholipase C
MLTTDRRTFFRFLSSAAVTAALPQSIDRALAIPANHRTGTIRDIEHIVFLMQRTGRSITTSAPCAACVDSVIHDR